jgi:hypothetical protein
LLHKFNKNPPIIATGIYEKKSFASIEQLEVITFGATLSAILFPAFAPIFQAQFTAPKKITTTSTIYAMTTSKIKNSGDINL